MKRQKDRSIKFSLDQSQCSWRKPRRRKNWVCWRKQRRRRRIRFVEEKQRRRRKNWVCWREQRRRGRKKGSSLLLILVEESASFLDLWNSLHADDHHHWFQNILKLKSGVAAGGGEVYLSWWEVRSPGSWSLPELCLKEWLARVSASGRQ